MRLCSWASVKSFRAINRSDEPSALGRNGEQFPWEEARQRDASWQAAKALVAMIERPRKSLK
jgi:hypothetical protein